MAANQIRVLERESRSLVRCEMKAQQRRVLPQSSHRRRFRMGHRPNRTARNRSGSRAPRSRMVRCQRPVQCPAAASFIRGNRQLQRSSRSGSPRLLLRRSLSREGYDGRSYDVRNHPSFDDFARGLMAMAMARGLWGLQTAQNLKRRFPPRPLAGMTLERSGRCPRNMRKQLQATDERVLPFSLQRRNALAGTFQETEDCPYWTSYEQSAWKLNNPPIRGRRLAAAYPRQGRA